MTEYKGIMVYCEVAAGKRGDVFFDIPALDLEGFDSVLLMVPGWNIPVGVGLLQ